MPLWTGIVAFRLLCSRVAVLGGPAALCAAAMVVSPAAAASAGDAAAPARSGGTAAAAGAGGAVAPARSGGTEIGAPVGKGAPAAPPVARTFRVPRVVAQGTAPRIAVRIDAPGLPSVQARIVILRLGSNAAALRIDLGALPTGRQVLAPWPKGAVLAAGQYLVRLHAKDAAGRTLQRKAHTSGKATLTVRRAKRVAAPPAAAVPAPPPSPPVTTTTPVISPLSTAGAVFPVQGPHTFGGDDARFGAGRAGHIHEGQDVVGAEGTPIVAPLPGIITFRAYQASAAGYYLVERASDGHDFFFAHCQKDSFAVDVGATVAAGQQLCRMGSTGDASGPHLHFEVWEGGWRVNSDSKPIDPLPLLQAWDQG
jgi:murein DD-endopeptidase MepM/ murein hydrolase activator NlpD